LDKRKMKKGGWVGEVGIATVASSRLCGCVSHSAYNTGLVIARIHESLESFSHRIKISSK
jgi:hypothetical protein